MADVIFNGPAGRLEGDYHHPSDGDGRLYEGRSASGPPIALVLHAHPRSGGTMRAPLVEGLFRSLARMGFAVLRFNFRGVGRSEGVFDNGSGELSDAAAALDWLQSYHANPLQCCVLGHSFGAWIGMQLLMRRPEVNAFVSVSLPANLYDFSFLAPCPAAGLVLHGDEDKVADLRSVRSLVEHLRSQKVVEIRQKVITGGDHNFDDRVDEITREARAYLHERLEKSREKRGGGLP